jgi:hypothetical protein
LAVTACLLVRYLGVWDDVRTVMLLTVLMFLATSVTFDEVLAVAPLRGIGCFVGGLVFALAVSEAMLRVTRLSLPLAFRVPYYLILALFFLYPVALVPLLDRPGDERLEWALFGFSPAAALVSLTLLPAIHRGRTLVRDNGSPWPWAWYPWTLFGLLGFAVIARLALLCWSMQHLALGAVEPYIFGPYFVVPFLLAVAILLLELGLVEGNMTVKLAAMALPPIVTILAAVGHRPEAVYQQFLVRFTDRLGAAPLYLSLIASVGFYCYAWWRRVPGAVGALTVALLAVAVVEPVSRSLGELGSPQVGPLLLVATLQMSLGVLRRDPWRCLCGAGCLIAVVFVFEGKIGGSPMSYRVPIGFHATLVVLFAIGAAFDDAVGRLLRNAGAALALLGSLAVLTGWGRGGIDNLPPWLPWAYPMAVSLFLAVYGRMLGHRESLVAAGIIVVSWLLVLGWRGYHGVRQVAAGFDYIALGMVSLAFAWVTSLVKGGRAPWKLATSAAKREELAE